jgi:DNA-binding transcriptional ArsR family regulator
VSVSTAAGRPLPSAPAGRGQQGGVGRGPLFEQFARVGKALGHPARLELIDLLAQGDRTLEALAAAAQLGISTTSAHLQTLKRTHLVSTRREGTRVYYTLAGDDIAQAHLADTEVARRVYLGLRGDATGAAADPVEEGTQARRRKQYLDRQRSTLLDGRDRPEWILCDKGFGVSTT